MGDEVEVQAELCCVAVMTVLALGVGARINVISDDADWDESSSAVRVQRRAKITTASVSVVNVLPADSRCW